MTFIRGHKLKLLLFALLWIVFLTWMAGWFWAFSFAYSDRFFRYNLGSRLPFLLPALLAVALPPLSGWAVLRRFFRRTLSALKASLVHLIVTIVPLALYWAVYGFTVVRAKSSDRIAFEADEAMGIGIDFALCIGVFVVASALV